MGAPSDPSLASGRPPGDRLDSWKEIAAYLSRDITTVQRWERREGMPVHRHVHDKLGSVYAFRSELDAWMKGRASLRDDDAPTQIPPVEVGDPRRRARTTTSGPTTAEPRRTSRPATLAHARSRGAAGRQAALLLAAAAWWFVQRSECRGAQPARRGARSRA